MLTRNLNSNSPVIFGFLAQTLTFGFTVPVYAGLQLIFSATAAKPNAENIRVPRAVLNFLPFAFVIGYLVPSLLMVAPLNETMTPDVKQIIIAIWQPWPAYVSLLTTFASLFFSPFISNDNNVEGGRATLSSLRKVYAFAFGNAVVTHQYSLILPLATLLEPRFFQEKFLTALHPATVFATPLPWASPTLQVPDFGTGIHYFLSWDVICGTTGALLWALTLHRNAHRAILGKAGCLGLLVKVALLTAVAGPMGAAVELMWERDELVIHETGGLKPRVSNAKKSS